MSSELAVDGHPNVVVDVEGQELVVELKPAAELSRRGCIGAAQRLTPARHPSRHKYLKIIVFLSIS
jgi:hypothetical protein